MTTTVHTAREVFLACLLAQCTPGRPQPLPADDGGALNTLAAGRAILLALVDHHVSIAGVAGAADLVREVARSTGAVPAAPDEADFVLTDADPTSLLPTLRRGTPTAPETGATLVVLAHGATTPVKLTGPGLEEPAHAELALSRTALAARDAAVARAPLGVDLFLATAAGVVALPRSTAVEVD